MKKIALVSAIALASITAAHAAPTVYGKVLLTGEYTDVDDKTAANKDTSTTQLVSNSSRIGFKGEDDLTDTTKLVYQLEYGIDVDADTNGKGQFYSRNTYLGLAHNTLGTVLAGRHDTPYKLAKGSVDVFNDYDNVGLGNLMVGEQRANNVIAYKSPTLVGMPVTFMAAVGLSENDNDANKSVQLGTTATTTDEAKEKDNAYSASLAYDQNGVYLAAGYDKNTGQYKEASPLKNAAFVDNAWRLVGALDMGKMNMVQGLTLGALYQDANIFKSPENEKSWLLSAKYKVGETPWAVKAQYINTTDRLGVKDRDATEVALGAEYTINKATKGHLYAAQIDTDNVSDKTIVGGGLEYKF